MAGIMIQKDSNTVVYFCKYRYLKCENGFVGWKNVLINWPPSSHNKHQKHPGKLQFQIVPSWGPEGSGFFFRIAVLHNHLYKMIDVVIPPKEKSSITILVGFMSFPTLFFFLVVDITKKITIQWWGSSQAAGIATMGSIITYHKPCFPCFEAAPNMV